MKKGVNPLLFVVVFMDVFLFNPLGIVACTAERRQSSIKSIPFISFNKWFLSSNKMGHINYSILPVFMRRCMWLAFNSDPVNFSILVVVVISIIIMRYVLDGGQ